MSYKKSKKEKNFLLILIAQPLTQHIYKRVGVNSSYKNWKIVYWNFLPFLNKKLNKAYISEKNLLKKKTNYINIDSLISLRKEYKKIPNNFFYTNFTGEFFLISLLDRLLSSRGGTKLLIHPGKSCDFKVKYLNVFKDLIEHHKAYLIKKTFTHIVGKIKNKLIGFLQSRPEILFAGNFQTYLDFKKNFNNKKIFKINGHDYNNFINLKKKKLNKKKNIVFIDQMMDNNFEFITRDRFLENVESKIENYWKIMDNFFNIIIKKFPNYNFIIAAHHRRSKFDIPIKKKFIFNKTTQLVQNAKIVFCHNSTAHKLAVLSRCPITFINMDLFKLRSHEVVEETNRLSKTLGANIINIKKNTTLNIKQINFNKMLKINKKKYGKFEKNYINFPKAKNYGLWNTILKKLDKFQYNY